MLLWQSRVEMKRWDLIEQQKDFLKENHEARRSGSLFIEWQSNQNELLSLIYTQGIIITEWLCIFIFVDFISREQLGWLAVISSPPAPTPKFNTN